jgi:hypothetical protein
MRDKDELRSLRRLANTTANTTTALDEASIHNLTHTYLTIYLIWNNSVCGDVSKVTPVLRDMSLYNSCVYRRLHAQCHVSMSCKHVITVYCSHTLRDGSCGYCSTEYSKWRIWLCQCVCDWSYSKLLNAIMYTLLQAAQEKTVLLDYVQELLAKQNEMHTVTDMLQRTKDVSKCISNAL